MTTYPYFAPLYFPVSSTGPAGSGANLRNDSSTHSAVVWSGFWGTHSTICTSTRSPRTLSFAAKVSIAPVVSDSRSSYFSLNFIAYDFFPSIGPDSYESSALEAGLYPASTRANGRSAKNARLHLTCSLRQDENLGATTPLNRNQS